MSVTTTYWNERAFTQKRTVGGMRPVGTVTFLFTDIEGSTRRWESDGEGMRAALAAHDEVLRAAVVANGGWLFKHTGDGVCAAFASARGAVDAATSAQRLLGLPVRMGIATGEAEQRGDDYFGPALNRAARVMAVGHAGQILLSVSTAGLVSGVDLADLGEHRLRDLSGVEHLFQLRAEGLPQAFPPLKTVNAVPGNLPMQTTSFVGRTEEIRVLTDLVRGHRLVTLTGVGGVGKTRLAVHVAAELVPDFDDGVWLVELAPVGDPAAVPDAVASALGITAQPGLTVIASVAQALAGRRLLVVLDNCEHLLDAAADVVEAILARSSTVSVIATSREGLRVGAEHLWHVPSLDVRAGTESAAVALFIERARAVKRDFDASAESNAVAEICARLDGIPLAIELAAARMVSMSAAEVRDRLGDRFRLLAGARRGLERHQTLRHAVQWSFELLSDNERFVLQHCSVFADGFDLAAIRYMCERFDEYAMLDLLDSLVRKSLMTTQQLRDRTRYGLLETVRQFAEEQLSVAGTIQEARDRHAQYYAASVVEHWNIWDGPRQLVATDWVDAEFANLRTGFRWATDRNDLDSAVAIAAHTTHMAWSLRRYEPVAWAEELLSAASAADVRQLPRLYTAAAVCERMGRPEDAVVYAQTAQALETDPRYQPYGGGWSSLLEASAHGDAGRIERAIEICTSMTAQTGLARARGLSLLMLLLSISGRAAEARDIADDTLAAAYATANPVQIAFALNSYAQAFTETHPVRALEVLRQGLAFARGHRLLFSESVLGLQAAPLETGHGNLDQGLALFDTAVASYLQAGDITNLPYALTEIAILFDRVERPEISATLFGTVKHVSWVALFRTVPAVVEHLRSVLGATRFDELVAAGAAMDLADAVRYARAQIQLFRSELAAQY